MITTGSEEIFRSCVEGYNALIQSIRPDGSLEYVNPAWLHTLGFTEDGISQISMRDYVFPGYILRTKHNLAKALEGQRVQGLFITLQTKSGIPIQVEGTLFPRYEENRIVSVVAVFHNVTEQLTTASNLFHELSRSETIIDLFAFDLTEINAHAMALFDDALAKSEMSPALRHILHEGRSEIERSSTLISNLKTLWQIARKAPQLFECDLGESLSSAIETVERSLPHKVLSITTNLEPGQYFVTADEYLLEIFKSLIHHIAMKDSRTTIRIDIDIESIVQTPYLKLQIKDHGVENSDIESSDLSKHLLQKPNSSNGLGLELTLAWYVIENYGGYFRVEDRVENNPGDGSNFIMLLRCSKVKKDCVENE
ncbi:MAG: PAS domain S-box protein [Candidatus Thorarchaeota archaeon]